MTRGIHMMLPNHMPLFVIFMKLLIFFNGQLKTLCDITAVPTDTCAIEGLPASEYPRNMTRAITPSCAGREGINLLGAGMRVANLNVDESACTGVHVNLPVHEKPDVSFSIKFFLRMARNQKARFNFGGIELAQAPNDSLQLLYRLRKGEDKVDTEHSMFWLDSPNTDLETYDPCNPAIDDGINQSDWTPLIGMKLKVLGASVKSPETPSGDEVKNYPWIMIGYDYGRYSDRVGHLNIYINGKIVHSRNNTENSYAEVDYKDMGIMQVRNAQFSCIEYSKEVQNASYFTDPSLKECQKFYKVSCERKICCRYGGTPIQAINGCCKCKCQPNFSGRFCEDRGTQVVITCEASTTTAQLTCPLHTHINVEYANFGRTASGSQVCHFNRHQDTTTCNRDTEIYTHTAKSLCNGKNSCQVQRLSHLGDPCYGTHKYLEVRYTCVSGGAQVVITCDAPTTTARVTCPLHTHINVVYANFGRTASSSQICHYNRHQDITTCNRDTEIYTQTAKSLCNGENSCQVQKLSHLGDPCYGTHKYLEVRYTCVSGTTPSCNFRNCTNL